MVIEGLLCLAVELHARSGAGRLWGREDRIALGNGERASYLEGAAFEVHVVPVACVARFAGGLMGYGEWARRRGYIHSIDDRYDHDIVELMAKPHMPHISKRHFR